MKPVNIEIRGRFTGINKSMAPGLFLFRIIWMIYPYILPAIFPGIGTGIEFTVVSGQASFLTASDSCLLKEGDGLLSILTSSTALFLWIVKNCIMHNFVFVPELLQSSPDSLVMEKYLLP